MKAPIQFIHSLNISDPAGIGLYQDSDKTTFLKR